MKTDEKYFKIIQLLHAKTMKDEIDWIKTEEDDVFQAAFSDFLIRIKPEMYVPFINNKHTYSLELFNHTGNKIEHISSSNIKAKINDGVINSQELLQETYEKARRIAMGTEQALDKLLASLEA